MDVYALGGGFVAELDAVDVVIVVSCCFAVGIECCDACGIDGVVCNYRSIRLRKVVLKVFVN